jgi:hypothetical protein
LYNEAYVVVENNDAGQLVTRGMFYDHEYPNMHIEKMKSTGIGVEMTRRSKRLGCSGFKDLIEELQLDVVDENTIIEISTFEAKGNSYEASDGNHDDLVMNLVLFGYLVGTERFRALTDINVKEMLFEQRMKEIEDDVPPFGYHDNTVETEITYEDRMDPWSLFDRDM